MPWCCPPASGPSTCSRGSSPPAQPSSLCREPARVAVRGAGSAAAADPAASGTPTPATMMAAPLRAARRGLVRAMAAPSWSTGSAGELHAMYARPADRARRDRWGSVSGRGPPGPRPRPARPTRRPGRPTPKTRNRSKPRANHRSWVTAMTVPSNASRPSSSASAECRSRLSVGSSSSRQVAPGQLEQQDLEPRLLATRERLEGLLAGPRQAVAVEHPGSLLAGASGAVLVAPVQDLQQGPADQGRLLVGLREPARPHPRAEPEPTGVRHRHRLDVADRAVLGVGVAAARRDQPQEVRLARPVAARAPRPARRTRSRGRTASSGRSARAPRR